MPSDIVSLQRDKREMTKRLDELAEMDRRS